MADLTQSDEDRIKPTYSDIYKVHPTPQIQILQSDLEFIKVPVSVLLSQWFKTVYFCETHSYTRSIPDIKSASTCDVFHGDRPGHSWALNWSWRSCRSLVCFPGPVIQFSVPETDNIFGLSESCKLCNERL